MSRPPHAPPVHGMVAVGGLRATNLARVLTSALTSEDAPTRADLAARTGTTRATATRLVDGLVAGGLLDELEPDPDLPRRPGRPGTRLAPGRGVAALGLQVDVDRMAAVVVDLTGAVRSEQVREEDLRDSAPGPVLDELAELAATAIEESDGVTVAGACLALPGIVADGAELLRAPNLGWFDVRPADLLPRLPAGPVPTLGNEAELAAKTVSYAAPGRPGPHRDFIYLSGSTGIGGAVYLDGHPLRGRHGWAGELGHVTVDPDGPACPCGSTGCLEQYAGARALAAAAGLPETTRTAEIARRAAAGEPPARDAVERAASALGIALASVVNVVDVPVIVLGGHLVDLGELLRPTLEATLRRRVLSAGWDPPRLEVASGHPVAAALGAAYTELNRLTTDPAAWLRRARPTG